MIKSAHRAGALMAGPIIDRRDFGLSGHEGLILLSLRALGDIGRRLLRVNSMVDGV